MSDEESKAFVIRDKRGRGEDKVESRRQAFVFFPFIFPFVKSTTGWRIANPAWP